MIHFSDQLAYSLFLTQMAISMESVVDGHPHVCGLQHRVLPDEVSGSLIGPPQL